MTRRLSPAAQAVMDQFVMGACGETYSIRAGIAAALYAAAHHLPNDRRVLAAIADELEGLSDG